MWIYSGGNVTTVEARDVPVRHLINSLIAPGQKKDSSVEVWPSKIHALFTPTVQTFCYRQVCVHLHLCVCVTLRLVKKACAPCLVKQSHSKHLPQL